MEEKLNQVVKPGYRVSNALAGVQDGRGERLFSLRRTRGKRSVVGKGRRREVRLLGCFETRLEQKEVESLLYRLLVSEGLANYRVRNELPREGFR